MLDVQRSNLSVLIHSLCYRIVTMFQRKPKHRHKVIAALVFRLQILPRHQITNHKVLPVAGLNIPHRILPSHQKPGHKILAGLVLPRRNLPIHQSNRR